MNGRVVEPVSDGEENELTERFQKLGFKKLNKLQERQEELDRKKREEKKKKMKNAGVRCFRTTLQGERCKRNRLWQDGLLFCTQHTSKQISKGELKQDDYEYKTGRPFRAYEFVLNTIANEDREMTQLDTKLLDALDLID